VNSDTKIIINKIILKLNNIEKVTVDQSIIIKQLYEELYKKKKEIDNFKNSKVGSEQDEA
jgi:hypothetical protein